MSRDKQKRPLRLRKETLRQLDPVELDQIAGGRGAAPRTYECTRSGRLDLTEGGDAGG